MTRRTRRNHSGAFKAKVAMAAIKGDRTLWMGAIKLQNQSRMCCTMAIADWISAMPCFKGPCAHRLNLQFWRIAVYSRLTARCQGLNSSQRGLDRDGSLPHEREGKNMIASHYPE